MGPPGPTADISLETLESADAHDTLRSLRSLGPVVWVPAIGGWLVTGRVEAVMVLRDASSFTVDDERFSTAVVVGTSMLSTDGAEHASHRAPFTEAFAASAIRRQQGRVEALAVQVVDELSMRGSGDLRTELAGPLAVAVITEALGMVDVDPAALLGWYREIVAGVNRLSTGEDVPSATTEAFALLRAEIERASSHADSLLRRASASLDDGALVANTAVLLFGAIETSEAMTANAFWHLLTVPGLVGAVRADRSRIVDLVEESLRMEPAAAVVDRYATREVSIAGARISAGDLVRVSLSAANRDPKTFPDPDRFELRRANARHHLAFVQGPHLCLGLHLARAETSAAIAAVMAGLGEITSVAEAFDPPTGLVFRKSDRLIATWAVAK